MRMKADQQMSRSLNRRLVLTVLREAGPKSRAEIAVLTGLSPAAVTFVVADFLKENVVREGQSTVGQAGRRPTPIEINYQSQLAIGMQLTQGMVIGVVTDLATQILCELRQPVAGPTPADYINACATLVERFRMARTVDQAEVMGIGVSLPGMIDVDNGMCMRSHRFDWDNVPFAQMLANRVHLPVWLDDDTNAFALAQLLFGVGRTHSTFGALAIGAGISCAVVINGAVHHGAHCAAGKLGHTIYDPEGMLCECGRRGCYMTLFSATSLLRRWSAATGRPADSADMLSAAAAGDNRAIKLLAEAGDALGQALGNFCNTLDPKVIVVGGEAVAFGEYLFGPLRASLQRHTMWQAPEVIPDWIENSWAKGAAALVSQHLFDFEATSGQKPESDVVTDG